MEELNQDVEAFLVEPTATLAEESDAPADDQNDSTAAENEGSTAAPPFLSQQHQFPPLPPHLQNLDNFFSNIFSTGPGTTPLVGAESIFNQPFGMGQPVGMVIRQVRTVSGSEEGHSGGLLGGLFAALTSARTSNGTAANDSFESILHHILMNETSHAGVPPAEQALLDELDRQTVDPDNLDMLRGECSISQDMFAVGDVVVSLPCGHRYKEEPIVQWLRMHNTCPVCRLTVTLPPP